MERENLKFNTFVTFLCFLLLIYLYYIQKKYLSLKNYIDNEIIQQNVKIQNSEHKSKLMNQYLEIFFTYLYNRKNETNLYNLIRPKSILDKKKVRIGQKSDGGYVLANDFENIKIAYSFGINNEISFDKELADKNIDVYMYDHTIEKLPFTNIKFHWKRVGITDKIGESNNMKTLNEIIKENGHMNEKNMILKMDIEGGEWKIFNGLNKNILTQFKYILVEFHFGKVDSSITLKVLKKLNETHQIFHLHCNNCCPIINMDGYNICSAVEISYIIKEKETKFVESSDYFPIKNIDFQNIKRKPDINQFLNIYQIDNICNKK